MIYNSFMISVSFNIDYLLLLTDCSVVKWLKVIREEGSQLGSVVVKTYYNVPIMYVSPNVPLLLMM